MTKVFPNASVAATAIGGSPLVRDNCKVSSGADSSTVLTVWKKSLILNGDGFTVFDADGELVYRVDNYMSRNKGEIFLMDAFGNSLLTIRRKKLSLGDSWLVFDGETADNPRFLVRKNVNLLLMKTNKCLAHVSSTRPSTEMTKEKGDNVLLYKVEGSYSQRSCAVYDENRRRVAEIKQKEASVKGVAFGLDIFNLVVQPGFDITLAMAIVILLDQMFGSCTSPRRLDNSF